MTARHILVVDDEVGIRELLRDILEDEGYHVVLAENAAEARNFRLKSQPDLVLLDIWMPDCDGVTLLKEWVAGGFLTMPVVMMSGHATVDTAVEATRIGAFDFLEKPIALQKLLKTVSAALKAGERLPRSSINLIGLGKSASMMQLRQQLEHAAKSNSPLLLLGQKGCGIELCARALHQADTPWMVLEQPEKLAQAPLEILQHTQGGVFYTGEIAELSSSAQKGLLLLIQKAEKYAVRVICSSSRDLPQLAAAHKFDDALLHAIGTSTVRVPALNDHREDIPELASGLATRLTESGETPYHSFDTAALNALRNAEWPGNLAQLENIIKRLLLGATGDVIGLEAVQHLLQEFSGLESVSDAPSLVSFDQPLREARDAFERLYFEYHMNNTGGNMSRMAEVVGLERTHLYRKLKHLDIKMR
jgi:DNA-binding NtrC family response regulator